MLCWKTSNCSAQSVLGKYNRPIWVMLEILFYFCEREVWKSLKIWPRYPMNMFFPLFRNMVCLKFISSSDVSWTLWQTSTRVGDYVLHRRSTDLSCHRRRSCLDLFVFTCVYFVCFCFIPHSCCIIVTQWCRPDGIEA